MDFSNRFNVDFDDTDWTVVASKRRRIPVLQERDELPIYVQEIVHNEQLPDKVEPIHENDIDYDAEKIAEPCWFYNNGGCRHKDGTEKSAVDCKYLHLYSDHVKRPPHLSTKKPCDKFNLEGECKWFDNCKYSHRNLTPDEWSRFYPGIPYTLKTNVQKRLQIESKLNDLEGKIRVMEFKQDGISRDVQNIGQALQQLLHRLDNGRSTLILRHAGLG